MCTLSKQEKFERQLDSIMSGWDNLPEYIKRKIEDTDASKRCIRFTINEYCKPFSCIKLQVALIIVFSLFGVVLCLESRNIVVLIAAIRAGVLSFVGFYLVYLCFCCIRGLLMSLILNDIGLPEFIKEFTFLDEYVDEVNAWYKCAYKYLDKLASRAKATAVFGNGEEVEISNEVAKYCMLKELKMKRICAIKEYISARIE